MTLHVQFISLSVMVAGGFYLGMALDTFRRFSHKWERKLFLKYFLEICFWLVQGLVLFYMLYRVNAGELRLYIFLSCLLGFAAYQALAASLYKRLLEVFIRILQAIYRFIGRLVYVLIISPIRWIIMVVYTVSQWTLKLIFSIIFQIVKLLFYPIGKLLVFIYQRLPKKFQRNVYKLAGFYSTIKNKFIKGLRYITFKRR